MNRETIRILSQPVQIFWAGWTTDTCQLQKYGWKLAVDFHPYENDYRLAMHHEAFELYASTNRRHIPPPHLTKEKYGRWDPCMLPSFKVTNIAKQIYGSRVDFELGNFKMFDAQTKLVKDEIMSMEDLNIFNVISQREQVLVDKADMSVIEHLEAIKALQSDKQKEIRAKQIDVNTRRSQIHLVAQLIHYEDAA